MGLSILEWEREGGDNKPDRYLYSMLKTIKQGKGIESVGEGFAVLRSIRKRIC